MLRSVKAKGDAVRGELLRVERDAQPDDHLAVRHVRRVAERGLVQRAGRAAAQRLADAVDVDQMLTVGYRMKAPVLRSITAKPFGFRFDTEPNRTYSIEGSEDLKAWEVLEPVSYTHLTLPTKA